MSTQPSVTIAIPVLNEELHIRGVVDNFLSNSYQNIIEIIVADGGSSDKTREIVQEIGVSHPKVKLIENPDRRQAAGMNRIIDMAKGEIIVRADGHSEYAHDYVEQCVNVLQRTNALNVSGSQRHVAVASFQAGIALASRTWFGNGGAQYKDPTYEGPSDTVFLGCFKTSVLKEIGGYRLLDSDYVNEDAELNTRLLKKKPDSIYVSPDIKVWYYPRKTPLSLWKQYYFYGKSRKMTQALHPERVHFRSQIPFLSVALSLLICILDVFLFTGGTLAGILIGFGLITTFAASSLVVLRYNKSFSDEFWRAKDKNPPGLLVRVFTTWFAILIMLFAHFSGRLVQELKSRTAIRTKSA